MINVINPTSPPNISQNKLTSGTIEFQTTFIRTLIIGTGDNLLFNIKIAIMPFVGK